MNLKSLINFLKSLINLFKSFSFFQNTAICLTFVSAFFLISAGLSMSAQDIVNLSQERPFAAFNVDVARSLMKQQANTTVGFSILLISFVFQMSNLFREKRFFDVKVSIKVGIISVIFSALVFFLGYYSSHLI